MGIKIVSLLLGAIALPGLSQSGSAPVDVYSPEVRRSVTASDELQITVYDEAHLSREVVLEVLDRLQLILQRAKIANHPLVGNPADPDASLFMYVAPPPETEPKIACGARRHIALKIVASSPRSLPANVLGMSSPFAAFGLSVRLFDDHIREAALREHLPYTTVLPYAMAHEIGHVLLRNGSHSRLGIMSSVWKRHEAKIILANLRAPLCNTPNSRPTWAKPEPQFEVKLEPAGEIRFFHQRAASNQLQAGEVSP
jgi:hypothetical protein